MKHNCHLYWTTLSMSLLFAGCQEQPVHIPTVNTISNAATSTKIQRVIDRRVITDAAFAEILYLTEIRESITNDGFKRIQVFLKNYCGQPFTFSYRFHWYDQNGIEVEAQDDEMWKQLTAIPGDDVTLTSVAPEKSCGDFKLRIISRY